jgi:aminoglycoside phosphotransferase (APT) family kinase protein
LTASNRAKANPSAGRSPRDGLAAFLAGQWGAAVEVEDLSIASAGARRWNVLFDAIRGGERIPLVATIIPSAALQIMPIEVEASNLRFAEAAGMPVPHVHAVCDDPAFVGGPFFVTGRVAGETIPRQILRLVERDPALGPRLARQCGEALARLHAADPARAHERIAKPAGDPIETSLRAVEALVRELIQPSPAFTLALRTLERERPAPPARPTVVHGDFRNGNLIVGTDGLRAALDWEICHVGDPMEDLGWLCQRMWRFRNDALEVGGFGTRADLAAGYEAAGGRFERERFHWWKTMGTLRWGLGLAGQAKAHLDGSVPSIVMAASGRRVAELEWDVLMLLQRSFA